MSCQNPSEKVSFEWSDRMILFVHAVRSLIKLYRHPISSVGTAPVCQVGGRGFKQRPDQQPGSLKNWWDHVNLLAVIWDLVSVQMIAYLCGDVKPLALSLLHPSVIGQIKGGVKEPTLPFEKSRGSFPGGVVCLSRITHHSYHGLWVGYSKLIDGLIAAATGALVCWSPSFNVDL